MFQSPFNRRPGTTIVLPATMRCPLCGRVFTVRGYLRHLQTCTQKHDMTLTQYEDRYPDLLFGPVHQFAARWFRLARFSTEEFGLMDYNGCEWCHIDARSAKAWYYGIVKRDGREITYRKRETRPLVRYEDGRPDWRRSFYQFREHLLGNLTLGIWPAMDNSFLMIDLDGDQVTHLPVLVDRLRAEGLSFYVEHSGKKGYHVWVFWDRVLPNDRLMALYEHLCRGLETDRNVWPFKRSLIKLPLGLHRATRNIAGFLEYGRRAIPMDEQFAYFLGIKQNPVPEIALLAPARPSCHRAGVSRTQRSVPSRRREAACPRSREWGSSDDECADLLRQGSRPVGLSRYYLLFRLATYLKDVERADKEACVATLSRWSRQVSKTRERILDYDVRRQVESVFALDVHHGSRGLPGLDARQKQVIGEEVDRVLAGRTLDRVQSARARATMTALAECLVRLTIKHGGRCHVSFASLARFAGVNTKRVQKWLPLICGETLRKGGAPTDRPVYGGRMFDRVGSADYWAGKAQEYVLASEFASALDVQAAQVDSLAA